MDKVAWKIINSFLRPSDKVLKAYTTSPRFAEMGSKHTRCGWRPNQRSEEKLFSPFRSTNIWSESPRMRPEIRLLTLPKVQLGKHVFDPAAQPKAMEISIHINCILYIIPPGTSAMYTWRWYLVLSQALGLSEVLQYFRSPKWKYQVVNLESHWVQFPLFSVRSADSILLPLCDTRHIS